MKLSRDCRKCGENNFREVKEIKPKKIGNQEKIVCACIRCGAQVEVMRPLSLQKQKDRGDWGMGM